MWPNPLAPPLLQEIARAQHDARTAAAQGHLPSDLAAAGWTLVLVPSPNGTRIYWQALHPLAWSETLVYRHRPWCIEEVYRLSIYDGIFDRDQVAQLMADRYPHYPTRYPGKYPGPPGWRHDYIRRHLAALRPADTDPFWHGQLLALYGWQ